MTHDGALRPTIDPPPGTRTRTPRVSASSTARLAGLVAVGGGVGVLARAGIASAFPTPTGSWPWTTFWINVTGAFLLGALLETLSRTGPDRGWRKGVRLGVGTGVLGGYTTYSTFAVEAVQLLQHGDGGTGIAYALISVVAGLVAAAIGIASARTVHGRLARTRGGRP